MNMRDNPVRAKLKRGEVVIGMMVTEFDNPAMAVILADAGFDFFILDMEHGTYTLATAAHIIQMARFSNIVPIVRVPDGLYHLIAPVLDAGAMGIMVPRVETRELVKQSIAAMRYPPQGERGIFGGKGNNDYLVPSLLEYARHANENILSIIQIESKLGVKHADHLLSTPGLDAVLVGPWDLALSLGVNPTDAVVQAATQKVIDTAKRHGVASGIHVADPAQSKMWRARGMTMLSCLTDLELIRNSARSVVEALRS
jgi:2-keto-3-deoxy-L-rhamnonate aldolase RhmA